MKEQRGEMFANSLKEKIRKGLPAVGTWIYFTDLFAVETMAQTGFDWWLIDTEHAPIGPEGLLRILAVAKSSATPSIVRLRNNQPEYFKTALDLGASGVMVPMINSAEDARRAVDFCRYPPLGSRGFAPIRASNYFRNLAEYTQSANQEVMLIAQIESIQAVQELEAIMAVPGIDAIFIGPGDLSSSMNLGAQFKHPRVEEVIVQIMAKARAAGMPIGIMAFASEDLLPYAEGGATLLIVGGDLVFMTRGATEALERTRALLGTLKESKGN